MESKSEKRFFTKQAAKKNVEQREAIKFVLSSEHGRRFVWWLLSEAGVFLNPFNAENAHTTSYQAGRQSIGQQILAAIQAHEPEAYLTMTKESMDAARRRDDEYREFRKRNAGNDNGDGDLGNDGN